MSNRSWLLVVLASLSVASGCAKTGESASERSANPTATQHEPVELLNVSYDPTRELWKQINAEFIPTWKKKTDQDITINMAHAGSGAQARAVIDGLEADVVSLAMWGDTNAIHKAGLIKENWSDRLPNGSLPYSSTVVFVVRKGNPKAIKDWPDLVKEDVSIITPNPKTSANGKLSFLAAYGSVVLRGGSEADAKEYLKNLYSKVEVLDTGARGATTTFAQKGIGDVHLTWENEAHLEVAQADGELELVYPKISIRAEPRVAVVDSVVDRRGTREVAQAYLEFLYTKEAQEIIAKNFYRPYMPEVLEANSSKFPAIELFSIKKIAKDWEDADARFFAEGTLFDQVYGEQK